MMAAFFCGVKLTNGIEESIIDIRIEDAMKIVPGDRLLDSSIHENRFRDCIIKRRVIRMKGSQILEVTFYVD
jgi:hypothetical protein